MNPNEPKPDKAPKAKRVRLKDKWMWSLWRILPVPILAYLVTGSYYWLIDTPDAWQRGIAPVLTVSVFVLIRPLITRWWFRRERTKLKRTSQGTDDAA